MTFLPSLSDTASLHELFTLFPRRSGILLPLVDDIMGDDSVFTAAQLEFFEGDEQFRAVEIIL